MIIAYYGPQYVGKTTSARVTRFLDDRFKILSFATPMRRMLTSIIPRELLEQTADKNAPLPELGGQSIRDVMKSLGMWGRSVYPNFWLDQLAREAVTHEFVVIDDLRFNNEKKWIKEQGGKIIRVYSDGVENTSQDDPAEVDWVDWLPDLTIDNPRNVKIYGEVTKVLDQLELL